MSETIALLERRILDLKCVLEVVEWCRRACFWVPKALSLGEANGHNAVSHRVRGLLVTYETEQLGSVLNRYN